MTESDANCHAGDRPTESPALAVQLQLHYPLCVPCETLFTNSVNLKSHLENKHYESSKGAKERAAEIIEAARKNVSKEVFHLRKIYENALFRPDGKATCGSLPALAGVEKVRALKCCRCYYYITNKRRMQQHIHNEHKLGEQEAGQLSDRKKTKKNRHTLQSGNQTTFFKVHFAHACEDRESQVYYREQDDVKGTETHNDFIATTRAPDILKKEGIEVEEAARLTGQRRTALTRFIKQGGLVCLQSNRANYAQLCCTPAKSFCYI